jgi:hypothetical protein
MGKGRSLPHAMKSKITPFGRWCPKPNARARCMGNELQGKHGRQAFLDASGKCKVRGN